MCHNYWAQELQQLKPVHSRALALQEEKLLQGETQVPRYRVAPTHHNVRAHMQPKTNK